MSVSGLFLLGYGVIRFLLEFVREPDRPWIAWQWLTMGQLLSIPMIGIGIILIWSSHIRLYRQLYQHCSK